MTFRYLVSYHYARDRDLTGHQEQLPQGSEVFADSGAFSAWSLGATIDPEDYAKWLKRWEGFFTVASNLDVIGDPEGTWENQRRLEDLGVNPLPVFHVGEPWEYLERYCEQYPYVALGGMVGHRSSQLLLRWAVKAFRIAKEHGTRFHGFGQTRLDMLRSLPWYSVDSASWASGHRYGRLALWDEDRLKFVDVELGNHAEVYRWAPLIRAHGGDPTKFAIKGHGHGHRTGGKELEVVRREKAESIHVNVTAWLRLERWLQERHGPIDPPEGWSTPGLVLYLVDDVLINLRWAAEAWSRYRSTLEVPA